MCQGEFSVVLFTKVQYNIFMLKSPSWFEDSPCRGQDRLFFSSELKDRNTAKQICINECLHREDCLKMAISQNLHIGVWGGKTGPELRRLQEAV